LRWIEFLLGRETAVNKRFSRSDYTVAMLVVAAAFVVVFTIASGVLMSSDTRKLISDSRWVQHTYDVLNLLRRASLQVERAEYRSRIYLLTQDQDQLDSARESANLLRTSVASMESLVADNPAQTNYVRRLGTEAEQLNQALANLNHGSSAPAKEILACQQTISLMVDNEQSLLKERSLGTERSSFASVATGIGSASLFLLIVLVLFGFLLRDAVHRKQIARQVALANEQLAKTVEALECRALESALLTAARDEFQLCVDIQQVYDAAANGFWRLLPQTAGCLFMINNSRQVVEVVSSWGNIGVKAFSPLESCCGLRSGQARWRKPGISEIHCSHFVADPPEHYLCRPIVAQGNTLGVLYLECKDEAAVESVQQRTDGLRQLVQITGMAVATLNLRTRLEQQSIRDPLTGLYNRHFMEISLERELSSAARRNQSLAVLMLDVDHFKTFNDTHGHAAGDEVLKAVARVFEDNIRVEDIACRYGGEEFTILLAGMTAKTACERADRIIKAVADLRVTLGSHTYSGITISIGVACSYNDGETTDLLLRRADKALYRSKHAGRNRYCLFEVETLSLEKRTASFA
jgi:diguanylate cyclase (GGDEF)-like protein